MDVHKLNPRSLTLIVSWRKTGQCVPFELDTKTFGFADYDSDKDAAEHMPHLACADWLVEALESTNLCVDEAVAHADFRRSTTWRGKFYEARLLTVFCTHCGSKIDIDVRAVRN